MTLPEREMQHLRGREIAYIGSDPGSALDPTLPIGSQIVEKLCAVNSSLSRSEAEAQALRPSTRCEFLRPGSAFMNIRFSSAAE